jgi:hypothetical protein
MSSQVYIHVMGRSEREIDDAFQLKWWYKDNCLPQGSRHLMPGENLGSKISFIHNEMVQAWVYGSYRSDAIHNNQAMGSPHNDYNNPPPWNPKLKDILMSDEYKSKLIDILNITVHVLNPNFDYPDRDNTVLSLDEPIKPWHIAWLKVLVDESEGEPVSSDSDDEDEDDEDNEEDKSKKELCQKGLEIIDNIMKEQSLNEGTYLEMCNILKTLHNT